MPRLVDDNMLSMNVGGSSKFSFSGTKLEDLGATEYTLVTIVVDVTGSVSGFEKDLKQAMVTAIESCKDSPRSDNLLVRVVLFSSSVGVQELHGFKLLTEIDISQYVDFRPGGLTNLYDAVFSAIGATNTYSKKLADQDYLVNGIVFVVTDGADNDSVVTPRQIAEEVEKGKKAEYIESLVTILIGINASECKGYLEDFQVSVGITQFIDVGQATKGKLAKLAQFISQSVSSQSQALGSGGQSQQISATI